MVLLPQNSGAYLFRECAKMVLEYVQNASKIASGQNAPPLVY